ncbi:hypothetical protein A8L34_09780 [Bacillus sp. FJAT-27264]|uniref:hypothetical protein n=1 Tax=Paenibacillus sp. (strain DSM 101736 / FJAT-27264) TaxID=1850362 RepID=UPI000807FBA2|nr:hypothetical protein [Bacillus sp. FJAT-27264]OBZ14236.1 hypothetical protein A8L34_09780 [Bacillus sp. FJAT-27264]
MKKFEHLWTGDFFLLHVQANNPTGEGGTLEIIRNMQNGRKSKGHEELKQGADSHRFIISRSHPAESKVCIEYPSHLILEVYKVDDRAYYPTESFFVL